MDLRAASTRCRIGFQSLNDTVVGQVQRRRELPVAAADVDGQAAVKAGQGSDLLGLIRRSSQGGSRFRSQQDAKNESCP